MASATDRDGQARGLGLRLELAQGPGGPRVRMHAGPAELAPGLRLAALTAEPIGAARPRSTAALREGSWRALEARLEVGAEALEQAAQPLRGLAIGGWSIGQVAVDLAGAAIVLTLTGPRDEGWPALAQFELAVEIVAGALQVRARRVWATGPLAPSGAALWRAVARGLAHGREGVVSLTGEALRVTPEWLLRRAFRAAGATPPRTRALQVTRVRAEGRGLRIVLVSGDMSQGEGLKGHVLEGMSEEPDDPLAGLRAALRAGDRAAALSALGRAPAPTHPGGRRLTRALAQVRAELLRFHDPAAATQAVRAWLAAAPDDPAAWWRLVVANARAGEAEGIQRGLAALARMPGPPAVQLRRRVAQALVEAERAGSGGRARAVLEDRAWTGSPEAQAAAWRALAIAQAGDPEVAGETVAATVAAALAAAAKCERRWCEDEELQARVAAAGRRCGRDVIEAERAATELAETALALARAGETQRLTTAIAGRTRGVDRKRVRVELQTHAARSLEPGALLVLAEMVEETGEAGRAQALRELAWFLLPGCEPGGPNVANEGSHAGATEALSDHGSWNDPGEPRGALIKVLRGVVAETAGIRAASELAPVDPGEAASLLALVEPELPDLRATTGLKLPVRVGRGGPEGGVAIRNEREPAIVVYPGLARLDRRERRFRLALAAALIRGGLAIALDPAGASLHELLAALAWLGEPSLVPTLPGAQTIVRLWQKRGLTPQRFADSQRAALAEQLQAWRADAARVARLATLLRGDHCLLATHWTGMLTGALLAIGRDARLPAVVDEASARRVCASEEARRLLRGAGLFLDRGQEYD
ncbi:hypothetical protein [Nannocystis sp. SCPEA4]|uniref:hypothetical protein n=1 Tax=Nannocystis sp. SCPEA4 TaxID=2996787 RepID=UPI00226FA79F|nr:hypothetical protein [Nannocystis sp. SCPEA4]MCY1059825.1 hypothetical protein [Nannocystis sp. SCPEA4]